MKKNHFRLLALGVLTSVLLVNPDTKATDVESHLVTSEPGVTETSAEQITQGLDVQETETFSEGVSATEQSETTEQTLEEVKESEEEIEEKRELTGLDKAAQATPEQEIIIPDVVIPELEDSMTSRSANTKATLRPVYRVYNPNSGGHLHTLNSYERDHLVSLGWIYEGISMRIDGQGSPVYRVFNPNNGEHFYTKNAAEKNHLARLGWHDEGVAWRTSETGLNVYRVYNPYAKGAGSHHYTLSVGEKNVLVKLGWRDEGVAWKVPGGAVEEKISNILMNVPYISQYTPVKAPWGCASAALAMVLGANDIRPDLRTMQDNLPMYPAHPGGQKGNVYTGEGFGWVIKPEALAEYGRSFGGKTKAVTGEPTSKIIDRILKGQPVLYYGYSSYQVDNIRNHAKVIAGYKDGKFLVYDPLYYSMNAGPGSGGGHRLYDRGARAWITVAEFNAERLGTEIVVE